MFEETSRTLELHRLRGVEKYAFLESFTVHARALVGFFFSTAGRDTDVLAIDFFADPATWQASCRPDTIPPALSTVGFRVGKEIAHLTYDRLEIEPEAWKWNVTAMREAMTPIVRDFATRVPPEHLDWSKWSRHVQTTQPELLTDWTRPAQDSGATPATTRTFVNSPAVNSTVAKQGS